jgi:hypothetical protein
MTISNSFLHAGRDASPSSLAGGEAAAMKEYTVQLDLGEHGFYTLEFSNLNRESDKLFQRHLQDVTSQLGLIFDKVPERIYGSKEQFVEDYVLSFFDTDTHSSHPKDITKARALYPSVYQVAQHLDKNDDMSVWRFPKAFHPELPKQKSLDGSVALDRNALQKLHK